MLGVVNWTVDVPIDALPSLPSGVWGHLHAHHHVEAEPVPAGSKYRVLQATGRGKHVGTMLLMSGHKNDLVVIPNWYPFLEGDETIVAQSDARPQRGTYPTNSWVAGEVVSEEVILDLSTVPAGRYRLGLGLYEAQTKDRAEIVDAQGEVLPGGRLVLQQKVSVAAP